MLLDWRDQVVSAGHPAPSAADMMRIGAAGVVRPDGVELDSVAPWAETIAYLIKQLKFGVVDPVSQLPDDLSTPTRVPTAPGSRTSAINGNAEEPVVAALLDWWKAEQTTDPRLRSLKEHQLRSIAMAGSRTETAIRRHLPGSLAFVARQLAEVIAQAAPSANPAATGAPSPTDPRSASPRAEDPSATAVADAADGEELTELELADWEYTPIERPVPTIRHRIGPSGIVLTWPAADTADPTVLYRVVSADSVFPPEEPQSGDPLVVTEAVRCVDARPFIAPVRHIQVWRHSGASLAAAAATEPVLHAEKVLVAQVTDAHVVDDGGSVVGRWKVPRGVTAVEVLRVPIESARREGHSSSEFRLRSPRPIVTAFVDEAVVPGQTYIYELSVEVELEGQTLQSDPVKFTVAVPATLMPVTDLRMLEAAPGSGAFDLRWTRPPGGEVLIYRTSEPPAAGIEDRVVEVGVLPQARLTEDTIVVRLTDGGPAGDTMRGVPWPKDWTTAYLTPVTVLDGKAAVGPSVLVQRPAAIRNARIVERTDTQVLTFAWPAGADKVLAYRGGPNQDPASARRGTPWEISQDQYVRYGGMYVLLPSRGCSVHLVPVAFSHGRITWGPPTSLPYQGLLRVRYDVRIERTKEGVPYAITMGMRALDSENPSAPPFAMVLNAERLPLDEHDGRPLRMEPSGDPAATGGTQFRPSALWADPGKAVWTARVDGMYGFLRLFACLRPDQPASLAVLDPPVEGLMMFPNARPS